MKKLIVLSVVLALFAEMGFAQITVGDLDINLGGYVAAGATLAAGTSEDDDKAKASGSHAARINVAALDKSNTFGGFIRLNANAVYYGTSAFAWGWWKPIDQLKLQIGQNPDGEFAVNYIAGWGFHASDAEDLVAMHGYSNIARSNVFYSGFGHGGVALSILPISGLAINLAVPYELNDTAEDVYKHINAQLTYGIANVGQIAVTYKGGSGWDTSETTSEGYFQNNNGTAQWVEGTTTEKHTIDPSSLYAQFYLTMIENLGVNIGLNYTLPVELKKQTYYSPVALGFGVSYGMGDFGIMARLGTTFAGKLDNDGTTYEEGFKLGFDLMPSYNLGFMKAFFNMGIEFTGESECTGGFSHPKADSVFGWYINPFVSKSVGIGTIFAGVQLSQNIEIDTGYGGLAKLDKLYWGIPIGIIIAF